MVIGGRTSRGASALLFLALLAAPARSSSPEPALERARSERLWEAAPWIRLGHWKRSRWLGRWESDASDGFFVSPNGSSDPRGELEAEISGLFGPDPGQGKAVRCRFPARAAWISERLGLEPASLAPADCSRYDEWRRLLDAGSASLIFASSYLANPSSMFGHTFLRLERKETGGDPLRDNTLNFSAETGEDGGVLFVWKGLLGLYPGKYTAMPYYMKIAEYNDMENRDLWEYRLQLSSAEVDRLAAHAWELGQGTFPYYFFSKNCSYQLMPTLEAAAPRLSLMDGSPAIVGPVDTLFAVRASSELASRAVYRPSHATVMTQRRRLMTSAERRAAESYAAGRLDEGDRLSAAFAPDRRALVLDSAEDYILYKKGFSPDVPPAVRELEHPILVRRARVDEPPREISAPDWAAPPDEGHRRHRLLIGAGARDGGSFAEIGWRPGYHDLLDRPHGYLPGAAIEGLSGRFRYDDREKRAYVRDFRLIEILSVTPWDSWTRMPSWSAGTGLDTAFELGKPAYRSLVYEGHAGTGLSVHAWGDTLAFAVVQAEGSVGSALRDGWTAGGAFRGGLAWPVTDSLQAVLEGALSVRPFGDPTPNHRLKAGMNWSLSRDIAVRAEYLRRGPYQELGVLFAFYD